MLPKNINNKKIKQSLNRLESVYNKIPETKGCLENNKKSQQEGGCGSWCCWEQNPSVLYVEFLNTLKDIKQWSNKDFLNLVERCLYKYLFPNKDRSCVFLNKENNLCNNHQSRPFNCRSYGIIPEEEFKPRYERLKILYPEVKNQCNLVSTVDGSVVTKKHMDDWWVELNAIEMSIGIPKDNINDSPGGSYRTYHDHLLLHLLGEDGMEKLSVLRQTGTDSEKQFTINHIIMKIKSLGNNNEKDVASS